VDWCKYGDIWDGNWELGIVVILEIVDWAVHRSDLS